MNFIWIVTDTSNGQLYAFEDAGQAQFFAQIRDADEPQEVSPFTFKDAEAFIESELND